ncbi:MAG TPA: HNH endonuclease signature motif containing protein [Pirellulales bacterium]|nr:HNH endonuclease signature motif containing protein [Pirellulales bacterium]
MDAQTRAAVRKRAADRCEYCQRRQIDSPIVPLQIEHVIPRKHGGSDDLENLALACAECNLHKSSNLTGIDPDTNEITPLFDPRRQIWTEHFSWSGLRILGRTATGRTTVRVLELNSPERLRVRLATWSG